MESALLAALGLLAWVLVGDAAAYFALLFIGVFIGAWFIVDALLRPERVTFFAIFRIAVMAGYFVGPIVSVLYFWFVPGISPERMLGPFAFVGYRADLSLAMTVAFLAASGLSLVGGATKTIGIGLRLYGASGLRTADRVFIFLMFALVMISVFKGDMGYMGPSVGKQDQLSIVGALSSMSVPALLTLFAFGATRTTERKYRRWLYAGSGAVIFVILFMLGRRYLLFATFTALLMLALLGARVLSVFNLRRLSFNPKRVIFIFSLVLAITVGMVAFFALREATRATGPDATLAEQTAAASSFLVDGRPAFYSKASIESGLRPGILPGYLGQLADSSNGQPLGGTCLIGSFVLSVPRIFLRNKTELVKDDPCTDEAINRRFGLRPIDSPTTIITQGIADFGVVGGIFYVLMFAALFHFMAQWVGRSKMLGYRIFAGAVLLNGAVFVEQGLGFYFVTIRNLILVWFIAALVSFAWNTCVSGVGSVQRPARSVLGS